MTTYRIACRGGEVIATERDRFAQFDGAVVPAPHLTTDHTIPGRGRVLAVRTVASDGLLLCSVCGAGVPDLHELQRHGRDAHRLDLAGRRMLRAV